jgi:GNAT superfamily N-acetyltransferase
MRANDVQSMTPVITVTDAPSAEASAIIENGLAGYNTEQAGYSDSRPLAVLVSDPDTRAVVGGLTGRTSLGLAFIDLVFLPHEIRGRDVGRSMMRAAEDEARRRPTSGPRGSTPGSRFVFSARRTVRRIYPGDSKARVA